MKDKVENILLTLSFLSVLAAVILGIIYLLKTDEIIEKLILN